LEFTQHTPSKTSDSTVPNNQQDYQIHSNYVHSLKYINPSFSHLTFVFFLTQMSGYETFPGSAPKEAPKTP